MSRDWMTELASHYEKIRDQYPQDRHIILFNGTILDSRYMVLHVLQAFDEERSTSFFQRLQASDIKVYGNQVNRPLAELQIPPEDEKEVLDWYNKPRWSSQYIPRRSERTLASTKACSKFQPPQSHPAISIGQPKWGIPVTVRLRSCR